MLVAGEVLAAVALRAYVFARPLATLDRLFVPDDTYYTLSIARSLAHGHGPTADGHTLTSGFQPLIAFLMVPVYWLTHSADAALRADLALLLLCDVAVVVVLACIAHRLAGPIAALVAGGIWALSAQALRIAAGGLETTLAILCELLLVLLWMRAREQPSTRRWLLVGLLAGLSVLARIDAVALVAALAAVELVRGPRRQLLKAAGAAVVTLAPWWGYCIATFGTPVPTSGSAAHSLQPGKAFNDLIVTVAGGNALTGPFSAWTSLHATLVRHHSTYLYWVLFAGYALAGMVLVGRGLASRRGTVEGGAPRVGLGALMLFAAALILFYGWLNIPYYTDRYLAPVAAVEALVVAVVAGSVWRAVASRGLATRAAAGLALGAAGVALLLPMALSVGRATRWTARPQGRLGDYDAATGYREQARWANTVIPPGSVIGAAQTGALGYFAGPGRTVVNLDGVVNPNAYRARRQGRLVEYAQSRNVTWYADWTLTVADYQLRLRRLRPPVVLRVVAELHPVGNAEFWVARVDAPTKSPG